MTETTPSLLNNVITIDDERIKNHLDRVVRSSVEETFLFSVAEVCQESDIFPAFMGKLPNKSSAEGLMYRPYGTKTRKCLPGLGPNTNRSLFPKTALSRTKASAARPSIGALCMSSRRFARGHSISQNLISDTGRRRRFRF
jgi:hypothetical protein